MLVLTRYLGEEIVIDGQIRLRVGAVRGDQVRLGICAPPSVRVDRREVHERRSAGHDFGCPGEEKVASRSPQEGPRRAACGEVLAEARGVTTPLGRGRAAAR